MSGINEDRDPNRWPTPREFVDDWEKATDEKRLECAERIIQHAQTAHNCHMMNHDSIRDELEAVCQSHRELSTARDQERALSMERRAEVYRLQAALDGGVTMSELPRKTLDLLAAAGITGADAATALDTFCLRAAAHFADTLRGVDPADRHDALVRTFGSDAARVASVLMVTGPTWHYGDDKPQGARVLNLGDRLSARTNPEA